MEHTFVASVSLTNRSAPALAHIDARLSRVPLVTARQRERWKIFAAW
jgi:hypothetical protein